MPKPAGFRFYHTHVAALADLGRGGDMALDMLAGTPLEELERMGRAADAVAPEKAKGYEVGYAAFGINGRMLRQAEPIRVRPGERVLFHVLNASATEIRSLALPGHRFRVMALDGNPVAMAQTGAVSLGLRALRQERRDPGRTRRDVRGAVVKHNGAADGFNLWTLNGEAFSMKTLTPSYRVRAGRRYRLRFRNASDDVHPLHLHRHSFELTRLGGFQEVEFDFVADNPGPKLFH